MNTSIELCMVQARRWRNARAGDYVTPDEQKEMLESTLISLWNRAIQAAAEQAYPNRWRTELGTQDAILALQLEVVHGNES